MNLCIWIMVLCIWGRKRHRWLGSINYFSSESNKHRYISCRWQWRKRKGEEKMCRWIYWILTFQEKWAFESFFPLLDSRNKGIFPCSNSFLDELYSNQGSVTEKVFVSTHWKQIFLTFSENEFIIAGARGPHFILMISSRPACIWCWPWELG